MQKNYEIVGKGFDILCGSTSKFICRGMRAAHGASWWKYIKEQDKFNELPMAGSDHELASKMDVAICLKVMNIHYKDLLYSCSKSTRSWVTELIDNRNKYAHRGSEDLRQSDSERMLQTMYLLCLEIDKIAAEQVMPLYDEMRGRANKTIPTVNYTGLAQPRSKSVKGDSIDKGLLDLVGTKKVIKTPLTKKLVFGGKTETYPVYKVRLDALFYNDQNDRIATWLSRYNEQDNQTSLMDLDRDIYNRVIEDYIVESNEEAIVKTQKNIGSFGQQVAGVTLSDGRVVDGNRRFTCLRRLQRNSSESLYFETVILNMDIEADKKQIKLLELAVQHGEEKKVDYDLIDYAIGTYRDIVLTNLLTVQEYAENANETVADINKRIEVAKLIDEFLNHIKMSGQYHIAREYQAYSVFLEMIPVLKKVTDEEKKNTLKKTVFNNVVFKGVADQRKFIRDIKKITESDASDSYFENQKRINECIDTVLDDTDIKTQESIDALAEKEVDIVKELEKTHENALQKLRISDIKTRPLQNVSKGTDLLLQIDPREFGKLDLEEQTELRESLVEMIKIAEGFIKSL